MNELRPGNSPIEGLGLRMLRALRRAIGLPWLTRKRIAYYAILILAMFTIFRAIFTVRAAIHGFIDPAGRPLGSDFIEFWSAARLALGSHPAGAYDLPTLLQVEQSAVAGVPSPLPFYYPPSLMLLLLPFGLLPYFWSIPLWFAAGLAAFVWLLFRIAPDRIAVLAGLAFPGTLFTLDFGQNGMYLAAALGFGLLYVDASPVAAGALLGVLSVKPHLFLLLPVALLLTRRWLVLASAAAMALALAATSWALFGSETWQAFLDIGPLVRAGYEQVTMSWNRVPSIFIATRILGGGVALAYIAQGAVAVAALAVVLWACLRRAAWDLQASAAVVAGLLVSPYLSDYDMIVLVLPMAWLAARGLRQGWLPGEKLALVLAWLAPAAATVITGMTLWQLGPILLALLLAAICRRIAFEAERGPRKALA
jgi:hypothetical protein